MPVLPFHRYIGPGNPIDSGPCVDADDCIAKQHDIKYENAKNPVDVRLADLEAIAAFRESWMHGNWHSLIGDVGLSVKYCVESYTGVIYPKFPDIQPCEIISMFNDLLKLHCVQKERHFQKFSNFHNPLRVQFDRKFGKIDWTEEKFFYALVAWYQLWFKYHKREIVENLYEASRQLNCRQTLKNSGYHRVINNRHLLSTCDMFHINTWVEFFSLFQNIRNREKGISQKEYNDEEFSELFLNYD